MRRSWLIACKLFTHRHLQRRSYQHSYPTFAIRRTSCLKFTLRLMLPASLSARTTEEPEETADRCHSGCTATVTSLRRYPIITPYPTLHTGLRHASPAEPACFTTTNGLGAGWAQNGLAACLLLGRSLRRALRKVQ